MSQKGQGLIATSTVCVDRTNKSFFSMVLFSQKPRDGNWNSSGSRPTLWRRKSTGRWSLDNQEQGAERPDQTAHYLQDRLWRERCNRIMGEVHRIYVCGWNNWSSIHQTLTCELALAIQDTRSFGGKFLVGNSETHQEGNHKQITHE